MNDLLILFMSLVGLLAVYWVLIGQWKYNKMMQEAEQKSIEKEAKDIVEKKNKT